MHAWEFLLKLLSGAIRDLTINSMVYNKWLYKISEGEQGLTLMAVLGAFAPESCDCATRC